jgi:hypothetical protein
MGLSALDFASNVILVSLHIFTTQFV